MMPKRHVLALRLLLKCSSGLMKFKFLASLSGVLTSFCPVWLFAIVKNKLTSVFYASKLARIEKNQARRNAIE